MPARMTSQRGAPTRLKQGRVKFIWKLHAVDKVLSTLIFFLIGVGVWVGFIYLVFQKFTMADFPTVIQGAVVCLAFSGMLVSFAVYLWKSIPARIVVRDLVAAESLFLKFRFILILWPVRQYADDIDTGVSVRNKDAPGGRVEIIDSVDSHIYKIAAEFGCITVKIWMRGEPEPEGSQPKSLHVICGCDWRDVVALGLRLSAAIVVVEGRRQPDPGTGFYWEKQRIEVCEAFKKKTFYHHQRESHRKSVEILKEDLNSLRSFLLCILRSS
jgi:uncharacterized membrane protein YjfL (UPF0719 family)